jgi:hypothetical protein
VSDDRRDGRRYGVIRLSEAETMRIKSDNAYEDEQAARAQAERDGHPCIISEYDPSYPSDAELETHPESAL